MSAVTKRIRIWLFAAVVVAGVGCGPALGGDNAGNATANRANENRAKLTTLEFSVLGMTCQGCASSASRALNKVPRVRRAHVRFETKKGRVTAESSVTRDQVREALGALGFEARFPRDPPRLEPLTREQKAKLDIRTVSHGEAVRIADHLALGKFTIFDYYAAWCGPCRLLTPKLERLVLRHENIALRKVDISHWRSEAARQATREFRLPGLPYVRVYGPGGKFLGAVQGNHMARIEQIVRRQSRPGKE